MEKLAFERYQKNIESDGGVMKLSIVRADTRDDLKKVTALENECFFEEVEGDCGYVYELQEVFDMQDFSEFYLVYVARELIGYTSIAFGEQANPKIHTQEKDAYYAGSVIKPQWRRKGLSQYMNEVREARAMLYQAERIMTCLVANNVTSLSALAKVGFTISDAVEKVFTPNKVVNGDRLVMSKSLIRPLEGFYGLESEVQIPLSSATEVFSAVSELLSQKVDIYRQHVENDSLYLEYYRK